MLVYDYIPLMSPVTRGKKLISKARFAGKTDFFDKLRASIKEALYGTDRILEFPALDYSSGK